MMYNVDRNFAGFDVYNIGYVIVTETKDGPATRRGMQAVLAKTPEEAIGVVRDIVAPDEPRIMEVGLALEGKDLAFAPAYA